MASPNGNCAATAARNSTSPRDRGDVAPSRLSEHDGRRIDAGDVARCRDRGKMCDESTGAEADFADVICTSDVGAFGGPLAAPKIHARIIQPPMTPGMPRGRPNIIVAKLWGNGMSGCRYRNQLINESRRHRVPVIQA